MANVYKPRYKIVYKLKNKILPYKNSRLWGFYDKRGIITFRRNK